MATQPLKKKEPKKFNVNDFKSKLGFQQTKETSNADKPMEWLVMPNAYSEALRLPGIPENYVTTVVGHSNVGKSTLVNLHWLIMLLLLLKEKVVSLLFMIQKITLILLMLVIWGSKQNLFMVM